MDRLDFGFLAELAYQILHYAVLVIVQQHQRDLGLRIFQTFVGLIPAFGNLDKAVSQIGIENVGQMSDRSRKHDLVDHRWKLPRREVAEVSALWRGVGILGVLSRQRREIDVSLGFLVELLDLVARRFLLSVRRVVGKLDCDMRRRTSP